MNTFLSDILAQPSALDDVLDFYEASGRELLRTAVNVLDQDSRLVLTSMGSAYYSLMPAYYAFAKLLPHVRLIETAELTTYPLFPDSLYLIMSRSGESGEIAALSTELRARNELLLAVTMTPDSRLARNARLVLPVPAPFDGFICTKAYTAMALVGLLLASAFKGELDETLMANLRRMTAWLEKNKDALLAQVAEIPWLGESLTFLSRGAGMGTAMAGALWVSEGAWVRADYSSIDQFRHGPVEQVDEQFRGVWIDLADDSFAESYMQTMSAMGGRFAAVRASDYPGSGITIPTFDLPVPYRTLAAAMPVQMIAYQAGINRGHVPGEMRYLDWIVK